MPGVSLIGRLCDLRSDTSTQAFKMQTEYELI